MTNSKRIRSLLVGVGGLLVATMAPGWALAQAAQPPIEITLIHIKPGQEQAFQDWIKNEVLAVLHRNLKHRPPMTDPFGVAGR